MPLIIEKGSPQSSSVINLSKQKKPSFLTHLKKIFSAVSSPFRCCSCTGKVKNIFTKREITLLRDDRVHSMTTSKTAASLDSKKIQEMTTNEASTIQEQPKRVNQEPLYVTFDPALESFREFVRDFAVLSVDVLYEKHIDPKLETVQNAAPSLPPLIKSIATLLIEIGDKAAKPLFQKFSQQKAQVIDPALTRIFKMLLREDSLALRDHLYASLEQTIRKESLPKGQKHEDYIKPLIAWLLHPDSQHQNVANFFPSEGKYDLALIEKLLVEGRSFLKIQQMLDHETLYHSLKSRIHQQLKDSSLYSGQNFDKDYIDPILNWLLRSDLSTALADLFTPPERYREEVIDKVFEMAITMLVERKVDQYANLLEKTLQRRLGEIVHHTLNINATHFADFFSERFAELIGSMPFTATFDHFIHEIVAKQISSYIEAEKVVEKGDEQHEAHRAVLEKAKLAASMNPKNSEELEAKVRAQTHLVSVAKHGGDEAYLENVLIEKFTTLPGCNPHIKQIVAQQAKFYQQGKDPALAKKIHEKALFTSFAENLLTLMLPIKKQVGAEGEIQEIDPFMELWDRLHLPDEFYGLIQHIEELASEFITPETLSLFGRVKQPTIDMFKSMFKTAAQDLLKKQLVSLLQQAFEQITKPESLNEIVAENILPAVNAKLVQVFIYQELGRNIKALAPLFHTLVKEGPEQRDINIRALQKALLKITKEKFKQFDGKGFHLTEVHDDQEANLSYSNLSGDTWLEFTLPAITEIEKNLLNSQINGITVDPSKVSSTEIVDLLTKIFQESSQKNDPIFGDIVMNLIFKVGDWKHEGVIGFFIKEAISQGLTGSLQELRMSHVALIDNISDALKSSLLDRQYLEKLFSDQPVPAPVHTEQKLAHQIHVTSQIAHDLIMRIAQQKGSIATFAVKRILKDNPGEVDKLITKIYHKLFGNQMLNENFLINTCEELFRSLSIAAEDLRRSENLRIHQLVSTV